MLCLELPFFVGRRPELDACFSVQLLLFRDEWFCYHFHIFTLFENHRITIILVEFYH